MGSSSNQLRIVHQRLGDADALQHALGVLAQVRVGRGHEAYVVQKRSTRCQRGAAYRPKSREQKPRNSRPER